MPDTTPLRFEAVTKVYLRSHLGRTTRSRGITGVSLELKAGEVFGLLGLNGQGKTTTMKLSLGLLEPTEGRIRIFGQEPRSLKALSQIGYLPELPYFYPYLTPREALAFYGSLSKMQPSVLRSRISDVLADVGLLSAADRKAREFSKGMLQRLGLAQAMLHQPNLYVLDEPVSGLDPLAIAEFRDLLVELKRAGKALLISSHSISEVERVCDRAAILKEGRLVRVVEAAEWADAPGRLEDIFVETVRQ
jgi:ABC-2 type transport system ATP-binding protein